MSTPNRPLPSTRPGSSRSRSTIAPPPRSDRKLRFIKAENDGGRFDPSPPEEIYARKKASFRALDTGAKGGTLIYQLEAKEGAAEEPDQLPWWQMSWKPAQAGQLPQPDSTLDPEGKGYTPADGAGKSSIAFMLSGASTVAQTLGRRRRRKGAGGRPAAHRRDLRQPVRPVVEVLGRRQDDGDVRPEAPRRAEARRKRDLRDLRQGQRRDPFRSDVFDRGRRPMPRPMPTRRNGRRISQSRRERG